LIHKTLILLLSTGGAMLMTSACGTSCQDILMEYYSEIRNASVCDPTVPDSCSVQLPTLYGLQGSDGSFSPEGLASNCNAAFNPERSATLKSLYDSYQAKACKSEPIPLCEYADAGVCVQAPPSFASPTGYTCAI